jgi:menaquinone-dependent protoporphyrinogen oxidase
LLGTPVVGYASKHGATRRIAQRIAGFSRWQDSMPSLDLFSRPGDLGGYEGFVIGSAAYATHWRKDAKPWS